MIGKHMVGPRRPPARFVFALASGAAVLLALTACARARRDASTATSTTVATSTSLPTTAAGAATSPSAPPLSTSPQTSAPTTTVPPTRKVSLRDAVAERILAVRAVGGGLQALGLTFTSSSDAPLEVTIPAAVLFSADAPTVTSMIVVSARVVTIGPRATAQASVDAASANMRSSTPASNNTFTLGGPAPQPLAAIVGLPDFARETFRVRQFAVWTVTERPPRDGYLSLGTVGAGSGPSADEISRIRHLFELAGLPIDQYASLG